ncbi:MAG: hypothetical protein ACK4YQ_16940 [Phenylobacterium sp.]|uniref:hypothetical protein n=1 Tax=Phenylobacterium sp. TaxID=1871053 RepID=UPI00391B8D01
MDDFFDVVAQRITSRCDLVGHAETGMNAQAAFDMLAMSPAQVTALVAPLADQATPVREAAMWVSQAEVWRFGVTMGMAYPAGFALFMPARRQIKAALRGWGPDWAAMPVEYAGGRLLQYALNRDGGRWLWLLEFRLALQETYEHQQ